MTRLEWWASAVRELSDDTLEQVTSGLGQFPHGDSDNETAMRVRADLVEMYDMTLSELGRRSKEIIAGLPDPNRSPDQGTSNHREV